MGTETFSTRVWQCVPPPQTKTMTRVNNRKPLTIGTSILCQCFYLIVPVRYLYTVNQFLFACEKMWLSS